jgi:acetyl esterase/lipase
MARLPSHPRAENAILRACCSLPPRALRLLFGRPPSIDGQRLDPTMQVVLRLSEMAGRPTLTNGLPPDLARRSVQLDARAGAGRPLPMASVTDFEFPGPGGRLPARLYVPNSAPPPPRPMLLYFHGGGWVVGGIDTHDSVCRFLAAHSGAAVLSAGYRLAPETPFPGPVEDAQAALRWTFENATELGGDPARLAVGGDSAGGNMATGICQTMRDGGGPMPAMQLLIYPVTDAYGEQHSRELFATGFKLTNADIVEFERCYLPDPTRASDPLASVLHAPDLSGLPPAYVAVAGFDPLRDEGERYAERLRTEGVRVAVKRHPGLIHTFANMTSFSRPAREAMREAAGALRMGLS